MKTGRSTIYPPEEREGTPEVSICLLAGLRESGSFGSSWFSRREGDICRFPKKILPTVSLRKESYSVI